MYILHSYLITYANQVLVIALEEFGLGNQVDGSEVTGTFLYCGDDIG